MALSRVTSDEVTGSGAGLTGSTGAAVRVHHLRKEFKPYRRDPVVALDGIDLIFRGNEVVSLVGPSGCGKTTLLRILGGLELASDGYVEILADGSDAPITSTVFQESSVFPWLTVAQNVAYGLKLRGVSRKRRTEIADHFIEKVGLAGFRGAYPAQLSGGMKQRTSVARSFANGPQVLLMDEPFASVDEQTRTVLQDELLRLWSEHKHTVIFVTHSIDEAIVLSDRIVVMSPRPGRVIADIPVKLARPRDVIGLRRDPHFADLYAKIWGLIRNDVG